MIRPITRSCLLTALCLLGGAAAAYSQTVLPQVTCVEFSPYQPRFYVAHFGYYSYLNTPVTFPVDSPFNYFTPVPDPSNQPSNFYPGFVREAMKILLPLGVNETWALGSGIATSNPQVLNGSPLVTITAGDPSTTYVNSGAPLCTPNYVRYTLSYAHPGTYIHQYLGQIDAGPSSTSVTAAATPSSTSVTVVAATGSSAAGISVSNLQYTPADTLTNIESSLNGADSNTLDSDVRSDPPTSQGQQSAYSYTLNSVYGDITVSAGAPAVTNLPFQLFQENTSVVSGMAQILYTGPPASSPGGPSTAGCPANITSSVTVATSSAQQLLGTQIWLQTLRITNTSGVAITGPIVIALSELGANAKLFAAAGTGTCPAISGDPYIYLTGSLAANASASVVLTFTNSQIPSSAITYTVVAVAGGSQL